MSRLRRGRRFEEPKLNIAKVIITILAILVIIMVFISIKKLLTKDNKKNKEIAVQKTYFSVFEDEKWGVINNLGEYVIKPKYDDMVIIPDKNKDIFICNYDIENDTYKTEVLNAKEEKLFTNYDKVQAIENSTNNTSWYESLLIVEKDGMLGLIDFEGKEILPTEYDEISALEGIEKNILVRKEESYGLLNTSLLKIILEPKYKEIKTLTKDYNEGYIVLNDTKYGIFAPNGGIILDCQYDKIENVAGNNMYAVTKDGKFYLTNTKAEELVDLTGKTIVSINTNNIVYIENNMYGIIDNQGNVLINPEYEYLKNCFGQNYVGKKNGKYGVITANNEIKLEFEYSSINYIETANIFEIEKDENQTNLYNDSFECKLENVIVTDMNIEKGYFRVRKDGEYKYYNFKFEEKTPQEALPSNTLFLFKENDKYGYKNLKDEVIVDPIYDDAKEQNEYGYCAIKKDGKWGVIKSDGTLIVEPSLNLDENLYIDFISNWYLYNDLSLNIYTR